MTIMEKIRCVIVDDELHCVETLKYDLKKHCPEIDVIAEARSGEQAVNLITGHDPDLVLLDVEMPDMSGFDVLQRLFPVSFDVVFVTAYDQYAIRAFRYAAVDYLLKPVDKVQLREAIDRVIKRRQGQSNPAVLETLVHNLKQGLKPARMAIPTSRGLDFINTDEIVFCQSESNYTHIHLVDGAKYTITKTLKDLEHLLDPDEFLRVHQSYLIHLAFVEKYIRDDGGYIVMASNLKIPIAKRRKEELMAILRNRQ